MCGVYCEYLCCCNLLIRAEWEWAGAGAAEDALAVRAKHSATFRRVSRFNSINMRVSSSLEHFATIVSSDTPTSWVMVAMPNIAHIATNASSSLSIGMLINTQSFIVF